MNLISSFPRKFLLGLTGSLIFLFLFSCEKEKTKEEIVPPVLDKEVRVCWTRIQKHTIETEGTYLINNEESAILRDFDLNDYPKIEKMEICFLVLNRGDDSVMVDLYDLTNERRIGGSAVMAGLDPDKQYLRYTVFIPTDSFPRGEVDLTIGMYRIAVGLPDAQSEAYPECLILYR